jgi:hypothetical protein
MTSNTGGDPNVDENYDAVDDLKEDNMDDVEDDANEEDKHHPSEQNKVEREWLSCLF